MHATPNTTSRAPPARTHASPARARASRREPALLPRKPTDIGGPPLPGLPCSGDLWMGLTDTRELLGLPGNADTHRGEALLARRRLRMGQTLCHAGEVLHALYVIDRGYLRSAVLDLEGNEQVTGFPMRGDLVGADALFTRLHLSQVSTLTACVVVVVPFELLSPDRLRRDPERAGSRDTGLDLCRVISRELARAQAALCVMGTASAEARLARFLRNLSRRQADIGCPADYLLLPMNRKDLGNHLGMAMETVSRAFSAFAAGGLMQVRGRSIVILDMARLEAAAAHDALLFSAHPPPRAISSGMGR